MTESPNTSPWPTPPVVPRSEKREKTMPPVQDISVEKQKMEQTQSASQSQDKDAKIQEDAAGEGLINVSAAEQTASDNHTLSAQSNWRLDWNSPVIVALFLMLTLSAWSKLIPIQPPHMALLELTGASFTDFTSMDRYRHASQIYLLMVDGIGVFESYADVVATALRIMVGVLEFTIALNLVFATTYDHRTLACMAAAILHLILLNVMLMMDDNSVFLAESLAIQLLGGSLVLLGLKQSVPFEVREKQKTPTTRPDLSESSDVLKKQIVRKKRVEQARLRQRNPRVLEKD
eukprot:m.110781 g.110781  ORF g.110781 m.110781 type:complete len:290 (-) comp28067_c0_seq1:82-951(-)